MPTIEVPAFWTFHLPCGCPFGSLVADQSPHRVIATEEQAWDDFYDRARERNADRKRGVYVTGDAEFDVDRWKAGHDDPRCTLAPKRPDGGANP